MISVLKFMYREYVQNNIYLLSAALYQNIVQSKQMKCYIQTSWDQIVIC